MRARVAVIKTPVVWIGGLFSAVLEAPEKKYDGKEREKDEKSCEKEQIEIHGSPLWVNQRRRGSARQ